MNEHIPKATEGPTTHGAIRAWGEPVRPVDDIGWNRLVVFDVPQDSVNIVQIKIGDTSVYVEIDNLKRMVEGL